MWEGFVWSHLAAAGEFRLLATYRLVNKCWNEGIQLLPFMTDWILKRQEMMDLLAYDKQIYDKYYYPRIMLKNDLADSENKYLALTTPITRMIYSELDDADILIVDTEKLPVDLRLFFLGYFDVPNMVMHLYQISIISRILEDQAAFLRQFIISGEEMAKIALFIPICYTEHVKMHVKDRTYASAIFFVNVIDPILAEGFPSIADRYIVLELNLPNGFRDEIGHHAALREFAKKTTELIRDDPLAMDDIIQNSQSLCNAFRTALKNHHN